MFNRPPSSNVYIAKIRSLASTIFPDQTKMPAAGRSMALGGAITLGIVVAVSSLLGVATLISGKSNDLTSILIGGIALTLGSFGATLHVETVQVSTSDFASDYTVGIHSVTIALIALLTIYRISFKANRNKRHIIGEQTVSPFHLAFGFALTAFGISFLSQGSAWTVYGSTEIKAISLVSVFFIFALAFAASQTGKLSSGNEAGETGLVWLWLQRTIRNFVLIYSALVFIALITLVIRNWIEPEYAIAHKPKDWATNLSPDQWLWVVLGIVLFGLNLLLQFFFLAMGINVRLDVQGWPLENLFDQTLVSKLPAEINQWSYLTIGPWAYIGVLLFVGVVALISGAAASNWVKAKFFGVSIFWKALLSGLFVGLSAAYLASVQASFTSQTESDAVTFSMSWGVSLVGVVAFTTVIVYLAQIAGGRVYNFVASAFPRITKTKPEDRLQTQPSTAGKATGKVVLGLVALLITTPIAASITNRVSALTDGPIQVGERISTELTTAKIAKLKKELNTNNEKYFLWLPEKILEAAQPKEGYTSEIVVTNDLDNAWGPGNLDANVEVRLTKDGNTIKKAFKNDASFSNSFLISHVKYTPVVNPNKVTISISKFVTGKKDLKITLNGVEVKAGTFYAIPGVYRAKAGGYKLVAATDSTLYVSKASEKIQIGYKVALPAGSDQKINDALLTKAKECFKVSLAGNSACFSKSEYENSASVSEGVEPDSYFEAENTSFKNTDSTCDVGSRTDSLQSSEKEVSTAKCTSKVQFSRTFYKSKPKQIPNIVESQVCHSGYVSDYWETEGEVLTYDYSWTYGYGYYDSRGYYYPSSEYHFDECARVQTTRVQDGYKTIKVRGEKINTVTMKADLTKSLSVTGTLIGSGELVVTK